MARELLLRKPLEELNEEDLVLSDRSIKLTRQDLQKVATEMSIQRMAQDGDPSKQFLFD